MSWLTMVSKDPEAYWEKVWKSLRGLISGIKYVNGTIPMHADS